MYIFSNRFTLVIRTTFGVALLLCVIYGCGNASNNSAQDNARMVNSGGSGGLADTSGSMGRSGSGAQPLSDAAAPTQTQNGSASGGTSGMAGAAGTWSIGGMGGSSINAGAGGESGEGGTDESAGQAGMEASGGTDDQAGMEASGGTDDQAGMEASGGTDGQAGTAGDDSDCFGGSQVDFSLVGWATQNGTTTGGKNGTTTIVVNGEQLAQALKDKEDSSSPLTILVNGTITEGNSGDIEKFDVKRVQDVSIIGAGSGADFDGIGIKITDASNIVVRNLRVFKVDIGEKDAISIEGPADHIWIDHCELYAEYEPGSDDEKKADKDYYDGLLDAKADAEYITYSWNYLHDSWKTGLVGSGESDTYDRKITMHHNYYRNCHSRLPLFRAGNGHIFNNYYVDIGSTAINSRINACLRVENNYFSNVLNPWISAYSDVLGAVELVCNRLADGSRFNYSSSNAHEPLECQADVPYSYSSVLNHVDQVPNVVMENAGVGKLADPTDF